MCRSIFSWSMVDLTRYTENILMRDPHVKTAIIFGRGRFNVGVLIEPTKEHIFDPADQEKLVAYRNKIWYALTAI